MFELFKKEEFSSAPKEVRPILKLAFPGGEKQLEQETNGLLASFPELFTRDSSRGLVVWAKTMWITNKGSRSFEDMCDAINRHENNRLTNDQCAAIYTRILEQDFSTRNK